MHKSVATIESPEFINLQPLDINPMMSKCEIKVLYLGENRNGTYISKEVATEMAKTLRGAPIVGYWREQKEDFDDHGERVIIDSDGVKFECLTTPYGFVAPDAKVWFKKFNDENAFGETVEREYLMTNGYLWTGQFPECKSAIEGDGKPQSMELDGATMEGSWETNSKGIEFFIINDATFSKLCILGEDVEPCFEGASVTAPEVSTSFTKVDDTFKHTLFTMMQELKTALEGGTSMDNQTNQEQVFETAVAVATEAEEPATDFTASNEPAPQPVEEPAADPEPAAAQETPDPLAEAEARYAALQQEYEALQTESSATIAELQEKYATLENQFNELQASHNELVAFKQSVEDAEKDKLINSFCMLSDEDKQDVIEHKQEYSLEEIEAKLSVICVRKKVNFVSDSSTKNHINTEDAVTTFNLNSSVSSVPAWIQAVKDTKSMRSN